MAFKGDDRVRKQFLLQFNKLEYSIFVKQNTNRSRSLAELRPDHNGPGEGLCLGTRVITMQTQTIVFIVYLMANPLFCSVCHMSFLSIMAPLI